jgi:hypothetical protein
MELQILDGKSRNALIVSVRVSGGFGGATSIPPGSPVCGKVRLKKRKILWKVEITSYQRTKPRGCNDGSGKPSQRIVGKAERLLVDPRSHSLKPIKSPLYVINDQALAERASRCHLPNVIVNQYP